jgi:mono/diheme cytochrome c family protein
LGPEAAADGEKVFKANCASCHGNEGRGDGPASGSLNPKPKDLSVLQKSVGDDYLFWRTNEGKPGTSMLPWRGVLSEEQIWQVVAFLRTLE